MLELGTELLNDLERGAVVVPSAQRATALQLAHSAAQLQLGRRLWRSPDIYSYTGWLERAAVRAGEEGMPIPRVLHGAEEWLHWREIVREVAEATDMPFDDALADSLRRSAQRLHDWRIPLNALHRAATQESTLLARVLGRFESRCADLKATPSYRLPELLKDWRPKRPCAFSGFIDPTPAQRLLMSDVKTSGGTPASAFTAPAADPADEIASTAEWCRAHLEADARRRLLIVIPDLAQRRAAVLRTLEQVIAPQRLLNEAGETAHPIFAIEGGQPLASFPLVRHALDTLRLLVTQLDFPAFSAWLRAPFWQAPGESERTRLDLWLRNWLRLEVTATDLSRQLEALPTGLAGAGAQLRAAADTASAALETSHASAASWARRFATVLAAMGWPGSRPLNSAEHQTRLRFLELIDEFAAIGPSLGALSALEAVGILRRLSARVAFEPATGDAAVTVTDALVDPVVQYDGIWVAGLHAQAWPRAVEIDPFLPFVAQREAGMPACSAAGRLHEARLVSKAWSQSTPQLVMSWPQHSEDGEWLASALLQEIEGVQPLRPSSRLPSLARAVRGNVTLEAFSDEAGAPWSAAVPLPAGTRSLEYQNLCPFRAYSELRLACLPLETPRPGVDLRDRGQLLHRTLEYLWTRLEDSNGLATLTGEARELLIQECIVRATPDCFDPNILREAPRAVVREQRRALRLVAQLCEFEERRAPFRVKALEARRPLKIAGASLDVRIDRIDELSDGTLAIFDYKTGRPKPQDWLAERPANPQLLVYLRAAQGQVTAFAAVHLTASRIAFRGVADRDDRLPNVDGLSDRWAQELARWHAHVERLAGDFLAGRAWLDPLGDACRTCHLHGFCRIADAELSEEDFSSAPPFTGEG